MADKWSNYSKPPWVSTGPRTRVLRGKKKARQQKIAQKRKEMSADSFEAPRKTVSASKRKKNTQISKIISDIMHTWEKTGKIGKNRPPTRKDAQKMAIAVAYSIYNRKYKAESYGAEGETCEDSHLDGIDFLEWSEEAEGPDCYITGLPNPDGDIEGEDNICEACSSKWIYDEDGPEGEGYYRVSVYSEVKEAPYAGSGALSGIGLSTDQLTSTWGSGDFDKSSLNSSGHMTVFANAEDEGCSSCGENLEDYDPIQCSDCAEDGCGACYCSDCDRCDDCCLCKCSVCGDKDWQMTDTKEGNVCRGCYVYCFKCSNRQHPEGMAAHEICNSCAEDMNSCEACQNYIDNYDTVSCVECGVPYCDWCSDQSENMTRTKDDEEPICRDCAPVKSAEEEDEPEYPCDYCGKPAKYNFQDSVIRWEIIDDDFENPKVSEYGGQMQNDFYCEPCSKKYETSAFYKLASEEGNTPVMDPMEFGEMANWRPMDGTPGLSKRKRAESGGAKLLQNQEKAWLLGNPDETTIIEMWKYHTGNDAEPHHEHQFWYDSLFVDEDGEGEYLTSGTRLKLKSILNSTPKHIREKFGAETGYNELGPRPFYGNPRKIAIDRWGNRRFIRRRRDGTYMKNVDVGRSIAMDRRRKSQTWAPPGFRDQGDGSPSLLERFRNRLRQ